MRAAVIIGCALLVLMLVLAGRVTAQGVYQCETRALGSYPRIVLEGDRHGDQYTFTSTYTDTGLILDLIDTSAGYVREYAATGETYNVIRHTTAVTLYTTYGRPGDLEICTYTPPTATPTPAPTVTPTGTPQPTATQYIPVLPTVTTHDNLLDLLPEHGSAISESATGAGFPLLAVLIWLIGWFGLLWLVRR
jgi:hypothetical protein